MVTFLLLVIGGLNWLLLGLFSWEIGAIFGGSSETVSRIIYVLIGLAAVYELMTHKNSCKACAKEGSTPPSNPAPTV